MGTFDGDVDVIQEFVLIRGQGRRTILRRSQGGGAVRAVVRLAANHARIENLEIESTGAAGGVEVNGCAFGCAVADVKVRDGSRADSFADTYGVSVIGNVGVRIVRFVAEGIIGSSINEVDGPLEGAAAVGVRLQDVEDAVVSDSIVTELTGGWGARGRVRAAGGSAIGVRLLRTEGSLIRGLTVSTLRGGPAGEAGRGGRALAAHLQTSAGNTFRDVVATDLVGWPYNPDGRHSQGGAYAFFIEDDARDNEIGISNLLEGEPVVYLFGDDGGEVTGHRFVREASTTNLGRIVLVNCSDTVVYDNEVEGYRAEGGHGAIYDSSHGTPGARGAGIAVIDSTGVEVRDNTVRAIEGGRGGGFVQSSQAGRGGETVGILLHNCRGCSAEQNTVSDIVGASAGWGGGAGIAAGPVIGILLQDSPAGASIVDNDVFRLTGGPAAFLPNVGQPGIGGSVVGVQLSGSTDVRVGFNRIRTLTGGTGDTRGSAYGLLFDDAVEVVSSNDLVHELVGHMAQGFNVAGRQLRIQLATVADLDSLREAGDAGIAVAMTGVAGDLLVTSSILTGWEDAGVWVEHDDPDVTVQWSDVWSAARPDRFVRATPGGGNIDVDPGLALDLSLTPESPCIDAGDPALCGDEPETQTGDGPLCLTDMGHVGGTELAHPRPDE